ncbi:BamA/TamA family outer membrane protein, partial [Rhodobacteraceae bacterium]|nr:BamA/TamA family outer membrane protein [Paracoccaceae bacterium]
MDILSKIPPNDTIQCPFITFNLREGQQFRFGQVAAVSSLPNVNADEFSAALKIKENSVYAPLAVENDIARLEYLALRKGIEFMKVMPQISRDEANKLLNVTFELTRSKRLFVERISIEGNKGTLDRVIRRYFRTAEGDPFNPRDIGATARRLRASGLFANVDISSRDGSSPEQVIIDIVVTEKATGSLSLGGSYSSAQGFGAALEYGERNFLGRGQSLSLALKGGTDNQVYSLRFTEPSFL